MQGNLPPGRPFKLVRKYNSWKLMPAANGRNVRFGQPPTSAPVGYILEIIQEFAEKLATVGVGEFLTGEAHKKRTVEKGFRKCKN